MKRLNCLLSFTAFALFIFCIYSCKKKTLDVPAESPLFRLHFATQTGLEFNNELTPTADLNIFHYMYFYNGGGIAVADFNKDNLLDLYFTGNQVPNKLFLNTGNLTFKDVSATSNTSGEGGWSTGATITDINNDGWPDIYVNQVGDYRSLKGKNRLYVWKSLNPDGVPIFEESAAEYGLDLIGFGTQAGFFDYDNDADLDLFQLNHSVHHNGTFGQRKEFAGTLHPTAGDKLFKNEKGKFIDVTQSSGIESTVVGYGLGVAFSDFNKDGWTDIYVTNDFHENDYLYLNQKNGTFKEAINEMVRHTSRFAMGVDIADINNDGFNEIFTLDMLPDDPFILRSTLGEDDYGAFHFKLTYGYNHQYARNTLQLNNRDNTFSEIGIFANVHASDWSWACLLMDFDQDGFKDIFVSNGIPKRMNDIDYVNFASNDEIQYKIKMDELEENDLVVEQKLPEVKLLNKFYHNNGNLTFDDISSRVSGHLPTFSNGAAYADFDNDGDLDIVVNNIRDDVHLYENLVDKQPGDDHHYISFHLTGPAGNIMAIGAKAVAYKKDEVISSEQFPVRGYLSFVSPVLHLGLGNIDNLDSIRFIWPDHSFQSISLDSIDKAIRLTYRPGLNSYQPKMQPVDTIYEDITAASGIKFIHQENEFVEFNREQLIPHMTSSEGPALAIGDVNSDGLEDFFIGSGKRKKSRLYIQTHSGKFIDKTPNTILNDSVFEEVDAVFADIENDGDLDLLVATGGNEFTGTSTALSQRIYINDGKANFTPDTTSLPDIFMTAGAIATHDFNNDGFTDIFLGGRAIPWKYGIIPTSYLLMNDGHGKFIDVTEKYAPGLSSTGMVKDAKWHDMDQDNDKDLILALEWGPLQIYYQDADKKLNKTEIEGTSGFWNFVELFDYDNDGDVDFIAGNLGLNSKLKADADHPVRLYINDFDNNGQVEQIMTYFIGNEEVVFPTHREVMRQLPSLKKDFLMAKDFAKANLSQLVGDDNVKKSKKLFAVMFENAFFENKGNQKFVHKILPHRVQFSPLKAAALVDLNNDEYQDVLIAGNYYENNIELGRYDSDYGSVLVNSAIGITQGQVKSLFFKGQVRKIEPIIVKGQTCFLIAFNNGPLKLIKFNNPQTILE